MKKTLALLLSVLMTISLCLLTTLAAGNDIIEGEIGTEDSIFDIYDQGTCGTTAKWIFYDDGILLITGSGVMENYAAGAETPWAPYADDITKVIIRKAVTCIGTYAFAGCSVLSAVTFEGEDVPDLGDDLFAGAAALETIHVPAAAYSGYASALQPLLPQNAAVVPVGDITFAQAFPDPIFREYVTDTVLAGNSEDKSDDAVMTTVQMAAIRAYTALDVSKNEQLLSLQGIAYFSALEHLNCAESALTALDLRGNPNLSHVVIHGQRSAKNDVPVLQQGNLWTLDLAAFLGGNGNVGYVTMTDGGVLENGIVTYAEKPEMVTYAYNTGKGEMDITWSPVYDEEEHIHNYSYSWRNDISSQTCVGSCACGEKTDLLTLNRFGVTGTVPENTLLFAAVYSSADEQILNAFRITDAQAISCPADAVLRVFLLDQTYCPLTESVTLEPA